MLLIASGMCVNGPFGVITTSVSTDLVRAIATKWFCEGKGRDGVSIKGLPVRDVSCTEVVCGVLPTGVLCRG